ncbi:hypothetical protein [Fulvimarina sp. MAC3]|uniref:hypothetical protein n=1 Tax=Fulvimarina sp. MAC3 TaxID=3148887 RepID=UPI0031FD7B58
MANSDDGNTPKKDRIGAAPASNDWDPGPIADQKLINALKARVSAGEVIEDDPLEAKHKARAYRQDFRTLDYRQLSKSEAELEAERQRIKAMHSTWTPKIKPGKSAPPTGKAKFASFGGSTISVEVIRLERGNRAAPDEPEKSAISMPMPDSGTDSSAKAQFDDAQLSGTIEVGEEPQLLAKPREGASPESLTQIEGIGPSLERLLYDLGVFHLEQIAGWTKPQAAWIENALGCESGRIEQDGWIRQAIALRARQ